MRELNVNELNEVNGGTYEFCDFAQDATVGFFTGAGGLIGGAISFGIGAAAGGFVGHMVGGWAGRIVREDMGCYQAN